MAKFYAIKNLNNDKYFLGQSMDPWGSEIDYSRTPRTVFERLEDARNEMNGLIRLLGGQYEIIELPEKVVEDDHD
ncbi:hypothetical protein ESZ50_00785 [Weissella muntiaci]|uniref:Uncharacterized protein n=1 Tax=Weissella muntiaci TaxID=2508881 RepID=A0A6C2CCE8_9LACO|nr:hypothetical protein [Weissella muntiaci]TYC51103.1 hypothetical protein ESZ50_00785 [Weissella muntiaci]